MLKEVVENEQKLKRMSIFNGLEGYHKQNCTVTDWREIVVANAEGPSLEEKEVPSSEW